MHGRYKRSARQLTWFMALGAWAGCQGGVPFAPAVPPAADAAGDATTVLVRIPPPDADAAGLTDAGPSDAPPETPAVAEAGTPDAEAPPDIVNLPDAPPDLGVVDGSPADAGLADSGAASDLSVLPDAPPDAGIPDLGPPDMGPPDVGEPDVGPPPLLVGAGDIASCSDDGDLATALLLDAIFPPGTPAGAGKVVALGDNAYDDGTIAEYQNCYHPTWGRHKARTSPVPGNHEYHTPGASGYFGYFGSAAGNPVQGWYAYDLGDWRIYALNSECSEIGGCDPGSAQNSWLRADLLGNPRLCQLAYWHRARWSTGSKHGDDPSVQGLWQAAYDGGIDVVLSGHEHNYERYAPQDDIGALDRVAGVREFVVGTGGRSLSGFRSRPDAEVELRDDTTHGVIRMTLRADRYQWQFVPEAGGSFTDSGTDLCHW